MLEPGVPSSSVGVLKLGLYDDLLTEGLELEVRRLRDQGLSVFFGKIEGSLLPDYLTRFLSARLIQAFRSFGDEDLPLQVELANAVLKALAAGDESLSYLLQEKIALEDQRDRLEEVRSRHMEPTIRPMTELSASALLTGARGFLSSAGRSSSQDDPGPDHGRFPGSSARRVAEAPRSKCHRRTYGRSIGGRAVMTLAEM